jgi:hypothetical protein
MLHTTKDYSLNYDLRSNRLEMKPRIRRNVLIKNAIIGELPVMLNFDNSKNLFMFYSYLNNKGFKTETRLNMRSADIIYHSSPLEITRTTFIIKLSHEVHENNQTYTFKKLLEIDQCISMRFCGNIANLYYAYSKILLYAFEHKIKLNGASYAYLRGQIESQVTVDIFFPIKT